MKNSYEVLSPLFMKITGFCVSLFLCIMSVKLFVLSPRYAYWQKNAFLVWLVIVAAFILCMLFFMFIFMKIDKSKIYLFSLYMLCGVKCVLFLLKFSIRLRNVSDANMMLKIILCFGFIFIFLEYLHAQTSRNFIREKTVLAGIMGIISCIFSLAFVIHMFLNGLFLLVFFLVFYLPYALHVFIFSLYKKRILVYAYGFLALMLVLSIFFVPNTGRRFYVDIVENIVLIEIFTVFCCTQLIPLKNKEEHNDTIKNPLQKLTSRVLFKFHYERNSVSYSNNLQPESFPMIKGVLVLIFRFTYFALLAKFLAAII